MAAGCEFVLDLFSRREQRNIEFCILVDGDRPLLAVRPGDEAQLAALLAVGKSLLLVAGLVSLAIWQDPDLQQVDFFRVAGVHLAVANTATGAHALAVTGTNHRSRAQAVL